MFAKSKISQSMIDAVSLIISEKSEKVQQLDEAGNIKIPTPTGTKVLGGSYGNSAAAHRDQTKSSVDSLKEPTKKDIEKDSRLYVKDTGQKRNYKVHAGRFFSNMDSELPTKGKEEPRYKNEEVEAHEKKMHGESFAARLIEGLKTKQNEAAETSDVTTDTLAGRSEGGKDNDFKKFKVKLKGDGVTRPAAATPELTPARASIHAEEFELNEGDNLGDIAKKHGMEFNRTTYGAGMKHPKHGEISINRYGEWHHKGTKAQGDSTDKFSSLDKHLATLKEEVVNEMDTYPHPDSKEGKELLKAIRDPNAQIGKPQTVKKTLADTQKLLNKAFNKPVKEEVEGLDEAVSRKDFKLVADLIKTHDNADKRKELANHHASIFAQQNPRFDHAKFLKAAGVNESFEDEHGIPSSPKKNQDIADKSHLKDLGKKPSLKGDIKNFGRFLAGKKETNEAKTLSPGQDDAPFDPPYADVPKNVKDKSGAVHTPMSRAKDLARNAMNKVKKDMSVK